MKAGVYTGTPNSLMNCAIFLDYKYNALLHRCLYNTYSYYIKYLLGKAILINFN